jgi:DNA recombination protein RmuC
MAALAGAGAVVWFLVERGRLLGAVGEAAARVEAGEGERARLAGELGEAQARVGDMAARNQGLEVKVVQLEEELAGAMRLHQAELVRVQDLARENVSSAERREREFRDEVRQRDVKRDAEMREAFAALSAETLSRSTQEFLKLAESKLSAAQKQGEQELEKKRAEVDRLLKPISDTLQRTDEKLVSMGKEWASDRASLVAQIQGMSTQSEGLRAETMKLARALSKPEVRGRYGEIQLRRVAELAGMTGYCDFVEQAAQRDESGRLLRPDMVVKLPNQRVIAVDAKCNTYAYVQAAEAQDEATREECLERFAKNVSDQVGLLGKKGYWVDLEGSPDFVVMFVPGDQFLDAALARRGDLLEKAAEQNVILASPSTLIGLLRAVAVGWREKRIEEQARELFELGRELHDRAAVAFEKVAGLGDALTRAVKQYNEFVGSYEVRLEPTLRKFEEAGVRSGKELPEVAAVGMVVREIEIEAKPTLFGGVVGKAQGS